MGATRRFTRNMYKDVPGTVVVITNAFVDGAVQIRRSDGRVEEQGFAGAAPRYRGFSLAEWRRRFGGEEGEVVDPAVGQVHRVSLRPWATANPETTSIRIDFEFIPDQPIQPHHQQYFPPAPPGLIKPPGKEEG